MQIYIKEKEKSKKGILFFSETLIDMQKNVTSIHPPLVDFNKALTRLENKVSTKETTRKKYLYKNKFFTDIPVISESEPVCEVIIKCNKQKHKLKVQTTWKGEDLFKFLSYSLNVPLESVKLIHKGKVLTRDSVMETVNSKAVYQVIGEQAQAEDDLDQRDISVMMKQCGLNRNAAIQRLRKKGDLLDALLDQ